ncbi:glycoside hydrolase [Auricularia subglabra TFB-10046 SS5]|nr:glycoside hydrolase [Auricularia subglabra TFB-10046 SS5]
MVLLPAAALLALPLAASAYDNSRFDNVVAYWGQNSYGARNGNDPGNWQKSVDFYCNLDTMDVFPISFLTVAFSTGGLPAINLANTCNPDVADFFPGSQLLNCGFMQDQIKACQARGKALTLSLGGETGAVTFPTNAQAEQFADTVWNVFLGGSSSTRPFGNAVLDGVDLDIEGGGSPTFIAFINRLRTHFNGASKKYYITGAPQCPYPDGNMQAMLNGAPFDAVYVQFYNNNCGLPQYNTTNFNFGTWDYWARNISPNKNVKVFVGAPASASAAGSGYVSASSLTSIATSLRKRFPSFGGVMYWDASQAYNNGRFDTAIKNALVAAGGTGFTFPACTAPAFQTGQNYPAGTQVSYNNYIWQARWFASSVPNANIADTGEWVAVSACGGAPITQTTTATTTTPGPTTSSTSTTTSRTTTSTTSVPTNPSGNCAGVAAWIGSIAYVGGQQVTYKNHLWTAKWWTQNDLPDGAAGVWTDNGACTSAKRSSRIYGRRRVD